jgi:hypothetical protein
VTKRSVCLFASLLVVACSSTQLAHSQPEPPEWVTRPTVQAGMLTVVGIVAPRPSKEATLDDACVAANTLLARSLSAHVVSVSIGLAWETGDWGRSETVLVSPDGGGEAAARVSSRLATWRDPDTGEGYCLVGAPVGRAPDPCLTLNGGAVVDPEHAPPKPAWVDSPPNVTGTLAAVGYAQASAYTGNLLEGSIRNAMGGLSRELGERMTGLLVSLDGYGFTATRQERIHSTESWLQGARMVAWWKDRNRGGAYALVCMPTAGAKLRLAARLPTRPNLQPSTDEPPAEIHEKQSGILKRLLDASL